MAHIVGRQQISWKISVEKLFFLHIINSFLIFLQGSYDDDKNNIILCIWCNAIQFTWLKKNIQKQSSSFWKARCALIGQLSSTLWLAEYLKHVTEMPLPYLETHSSYVSIQRFELNLCAKLEYHIKHMRINHRFHPTSQREQNRHFLVNCGTK